MVTINTGLTKYLDKKGNILTEEQYLRIQAGMDKNDQPEEGEQFEAKAPNPKSKI